MWLRKLGSSVPRPGSQEWKREARRVKDGGGADARNNQCRPEGQYDGHNGNDCESGTGPVVERQTQRPPEPDEMYPDNEGDHGSDELRPPEMDERGYGNGDEDRFR